MKKLNHDRPSLKLLDNFRRELARENSNTATNSGSEFGQFRTRAEREDALEIHEQRCKSFAPDMQAAVSILRDCFEKLQKTQNELLIHKSTERQRRFQRGMIIRFHKKNVSECKGALIDAGAIPDNERVNQPKRNKVMVENKEELDAYDQIQKRLVSLLDSGDNAGAKHIVLLITNYWQQRAKVGEYIRLHSTQFF